ncbi:hypothetical protein GCM10009765_25330 [Fodinicola feengrottensis]|uniref:TIGR04222 domain-containing membrane protein n=1 Tax=Fodinicola feengrottensis TaxID=435914 RepID=A0ABP4SNB0_9ACTN
MWTELAQRPGLRFSDIAEAGRVTWAVTDLQERLRAHGAFPSEAYKWFTVTLFVLALAAIPYYFVLACIRMSIAPLDSDNPRGFALCVFVIASIAAVVGLLYGRRLSVRGDAVVRRIGRQLPPHLAQTAWPTVAAATVGLIVATYGGAAIWPGDPRFAQAASIELTTGIPLKSSNKAAGCSGSSCSGGDSGCGSGCGGCGGAS